MYDEVWRAECIRIRQSKSAVDTLSLDDRSSSGFTDNMTKVRTETHCTHGGEVRCA